MVHGGRQAEPGQDFQATPLHQGMKPLAPMEDRDGGSRLRQFPMALLAAFAAILPSYRFNLELDA